MSTAPTTRVELLYEGEDISRDIATHLLSMTYNDNETGKADDIEIRLKDEKKLWSGPWLPRKGDTIQAAIVHTVSGNEKRLDLGRFSIDELEFTGPPSIVSIKGVSIPLNTDIRRLQKTRAWEDATLSEIASEVAATGELELLFITDADPKYQRVDQREESDLKFLMRLCDQEGYSLKITDRQLVLFDPDKQREEPPVKSLVMGRDYIKSWNFKTQSHDVYSTIIVVFKDPLTGDLNEYTYTDPNVVGGQTSKLVKRAESIEEAERRAKAAMRRHNRLESTGTLTLMGSTDLVAGATIEYSSGSAWDGKFIITKATHTVASGYEVSIDIAAVKLEGEQLA